MKLIIYIPIVILSFLHMSGLAFGDIQSLTLTTAPYEITKDAEGYDRIQMEDCHSSGAPGNPALPVRAYRILMPPDTIMSTLTMTIVGRDSEVLDGAFNLRPASPDTASVDGTTIHHWPFGADIVDGKNMAVYGSDSFFPSEPVRLLPYSQMRKWKYASILFTPFQYNSVSKQIQIQSRVQVTLTYQRAGNPIAEQAISDSALDHLAPGMFSNYPDLGNVYSAPPGDGAGPVNDYVIITSNAVESGSVKLSAFVAFLRNRGHSVLVITEDEFGVLTGQAPNHKAEKIRQWLKDNYLSMGIEYVLLIGDPTPFENTEGDVPMKMCWPRRGAGTYEESPTDVFYSELTGNWDLDGDEYYGEYDGDIGIGGIDFTVEVYVGRIPVYESDYTTLDQILQKIMDYYDEVDTAWRKNVLLPMSYSSTTYDGAPLAEQMKDDFLTSLGYSYWTQYQQGGSSCPALDSMYSSDEELRGGTMVRDKWAANDYGIVTWWAHGSATSAAVGCDGCWDGTLLDSTQTSALDDDHPSFTFQISCLNGYPENTNNLGYAVLKQGGIATISASRVSWFNTGVGYGEFDGSSTNSGIGYEYVSRLSQNLPAGRALAQAKQAVVADIYSNTRLMNIYDFNLYGDPALNIEPPQPANNAPATYDQNVATKLDTPIDITLTAVDADGDSLTYSIVTSPIHGALSGTPPAVIYTPDSGYKGTDRFTFKAKDGMDDSNTAAVNITVDAYTLTVDKAGPGVGAVTSSPSGIECGDDCTEPYAGGTLITLTAFPQAGSALSGWGNPSCPGNGVCRVTMNEDRTLVATFQFDGDNDGVGNDVENGGPNGGDGDGNGVLDSQEPNVATFTNINGQYITLVSENGTLLRKVCAETNPSSGNSPERVAFLQGFVGFTLENLTPGASTRVTMHLHHFDDVRSYYKYGPTPDDHTFHWYSFNYENGLGAEINPGENKVTIVLHLTDGQKGDDDLTANGVIQDIGAPAKPDEGGTTGGDGDGTGGGGGCFISFFH